MIRYNTLNLKNTTDSYEKHFQLINNMVLSFFINKITQSLDVPNIDFNAANQVIAMIQTQVSNPQLYLNNLLLFYRNYSLVLDKSRGGRLDNFFDQSQPSHDFPKAFWIKQFNDKYTFQLFPINETMDSMINTSSYTNKKLLPLIIKSEVYPNFYAMALIDSQKVFEAYHHSINNKFYMLDKLGQPLFSSDVAEIRPPLKFGSDEGYTKQGEFYFFHKKGSASGLTYVNIIPIDNIVSQANRFNVTLLLLLFISVAISLIVSFLFSLRFNNPVKKMVEAMQQLNTKTSFNSRIQEFEILGNQVNDIIRANQVIHQDLSKKNSLLRYYAYTSKLKNILGNLRGFEDLTSGSSKPFRFVIFQLNFKKLLQEKLEIQEENAIYSLKEFISHSMTEPFSDSHTFLVEKYEILTLINHQEGDTDVQQVLLNMKKIFDLDQDYCFITMAMSSLYTNATDFTVAYEEVLELLKQRSFNDETQIILEKMHNASVLLIPPSQEQEFDANLAAGNELIVLPWLERQMAYMVKKELNASFFTRFTEEIIQKVKKAFHLSQLDYTAFQEALAPAAQLKQCYNAAQLELFLLEFLTEALKIIKEKKDKRNHIINFVTSYVEANFSKDFTLESVADKLNITGGYLSTYFKEKTGMNFNDYVNLVRVQMAQNHLKHSQLQIQEIASKVGYQNLNSFNRMFRKFTGVTPSDYRKDIQNGTL